MSRTWSAFRYRHLLRPARRQPCRKDFRPRLVELESRLVPANEARVVSLFAPARLKLLAETCLTGVGPPRILEPCCSWQLWGYVNVRRLSAVVRPTRRRAALKLGSSISGAAALNS